MNLLPNSLPATGESLPLSEGSLSGLAMLPVSAAGLGIGWLRNPWAAIRSVAAKHARETAAGVFNRCHQDCWNSLERYFLLAFCSTYDKRLDSFQKQAHRGDSIGGGT